MKTIYFSGSISGGREDRTFYRRIVNALENAGHRVYAGAVTSESIDAAGEPLEPVQIFERDLRWIEEVAQAGGVLVAEVSRPSIGVGYEIAAARYRYNLPVICLYRPAFTSRCSGMIAGDRDIQLIEYTEEVFDGAVDHLIRLLSE
jgi:2'-deoxynucleoside 5'-phosphate N-hydrolase